MKHSKPMFHLSCFLPDKYLHETMLFLEARHVFNLEVKTVRQHVTEEKLPNKPSTVSKTGKHSRRSSVPIFQKIMKKGHAYSVEELKPLYKKEGRSPAGIRTSIGNAVKVGAVIHEGRNQYRIAE